MEPEANPRQQTWNLLIEVQPLNQFPGMVIGDFNIILFPHEKFGHKSRNERLMHNFQQAMEDYNLHDVSHSDNFFT